MSSRKYAPARLEAIFPTLLALAAISNPAGAASPPGVDADLAPADHAAVMREWRQRRHERLSSEDGWLTLVGLEWLKDGANRLGSSTDNDIRLPGGPGHRSRWTARRRRLRASWLTTRASPPSCAAAP